MIEPELSGCGGWWAIQQIQAEQLQGPIEFLSEEEGRRSTAANRGTLERPWELWKKEALRRK